MTKPRVTSALIALLLFPVLGYAAEPVRLSGREAEAIELATQVFKSKQGSKDEEGHPVYGDLKHYTVQIERHGPNLEVVFVAEWAPSEKPHPGGSTDYGWEVHYIIALDQMKILEEHYAR
jgi:hypothetical protein